MAQDIMIIIAVNLALYLKTLRYKFVSDDFSMFKNPPDTKNWLHKQCLRFVGSGKWDSKSHGWWKDVNGKYSYDVRDTAEFEHLLALLIHVAICVMMYLAFGSFVAALLYSVNPVNNQGTIWPGGRGYALPILCILTAIAFPVTALPALTFSAWFTIGFLAPLALIGGPYMGLLIWLPVAWLLNIRKFGSAVKRKHDSESFVADKFSLHPKKFVLAIKTLGFYLLLCIFPTKITFYHNFLQSLAGNEIMQKRGFKVDRYFWTGFFALGLLMAAYLNSPGMMAWAFLAFCIAVAPFCNFVRANQEIAERFVALPNVFLMYWLAMLISPYPVIVSAFVAFYATRTYYTLIMYQDEYFITEVAAIEDQHAWWAWHCRAMKRWDTKSYREALILWVMARMISPNEFKLLINIATCLRLLEQHKEADEFLKLAEKNIIAGQEKDSLEFIRRHKAGNLPLLL